MGTQLPVSILVVEDNIAEEEESFLGNLRLLSTGLSVTVMPQEAEIFIVDNDSKNFHNFLLILLFKRIINFKYYYIYIGLHDDYQVNVMILDIFLQYFA